MAPLTDIDEANSTIAELCGEIERLREQLRLMRQRMFGRRREVVDPNQLMLFEAGIEKLAKLEQQAGWQAEPVEPKQDKKSPATGVPLSPSTCRAMTSSWTCRRRSAAAWSATR